MNYQIISVGVMLSGTKALETLVKEVNAAIAMGWEPVGGVALVNARVVQAMVKRR